MDVFIIEDFLEVVLFNRFIIFLILRGFVYKIEVNLKV